MIAAVINALGLDIQDYILSRSSLIKYRSQHREEIAKLFLENVKVQYNVNNRFEYSRIKIYSMNMFDSSMTSIVFYGQRICATLGRKNDA